nr:hypothetical protein [uncultured Oscillibacter sp.]
MKHKLISFCLAALALCAAAVPALAVGQEQYPIEVQEYMEGDNPRIKKVYQLSLNDDPAGIPTGDFERDGRLYFLLDMTRKDEVGVDTQPHTETVTLDSDTGKLEEVLKRLNPELEIATEDGYTGTLALDYTSVTVEAAGYATKTRTLSATRTYPNLSDADLSLIPKTIEDGGKTLTLADVQWEGTEQMEAGATITRYTATATYGGTSSTQYATGYTVTASYAGEVARTDCKVVTYTAIFGSMEASAKAEQPQTEESGEAGTVRWPLALGCVGGVGLLALGGWFAVKKWRGRRYGV